MPEIGSPACSRWCLYATRWKEALDADVAPPRSPRATHENALEYVPFD